jgi:ribonuclease HI
MNAQDAFKHWQNQHKVNLQVYTDSQLFEHGFNAAQTVIHELEKIVKELDRENHKLKADIKKSRKVNKHEIIEPE